MIRWAIFVSGEGTNLQNVLEIEKKSLRLQEVGLVVADRECKGLERARSFKKELFLCSPKSENFSSELLNRLKASQIDSLFLLGFMRILPQTFLQSWTGRLVNLHPSLLPAYKGKDAVKQALEAKENILGVTLHKVVAEVDSGEILRQISFPRDKNATESDIFDRVHEFERKLVRDFLFDLEREEERRVALDS